MFPCKFGKTFKRTYFASLLRAAPNDMSLLDSFVFFFNKMENKMISKIILTYKCLFILLLPLTSLKTAIVLLLY